MSITGSSGNPPGLQRNELNQQQQTATDTVEKQGVMLVKDTLEFPLSQMGGNIWKYRSDSDRPMLPMYLQVALSKKDKDPSQWTKIFEDIKNTLPDDLKRAMDRADAMDDPRIRGLIISLQRFSKTLDLIRALPNTISEQEQMRREKEIAGQDLGFLEQLVRSSERILGILAPGPERQALSFLVERVKILIPIVISKRKSEQTTSDVIIEIERLRKDLQKDFGEKIPSIFLTILDALEGLHHLSYPGDNHLFLHTLLHLESLFRGGTFSIMGTTYRKIAEVLLPPMDRPFLKEQRTLVAMLLALSFTALTFGVKRGEVADTLSLALFLSEKVLLGAGTALLEGIHLTVPVARAVGEDLLATLVGFLLADTYPEEEEGVIHVLERPFTRLMQVVGKRHTGEESAYLQRVLYALEGHRASELFGFARGAFERIGIKEEHWTRDLKALQVFYEFVQMAFEEKEKGGGEMVLSHQSA